MSGYLDSTPEGSTDVDLVVLVAPVLSLSLSSPGATCAGPWPTPPPKKELAFLPQAAIPCFSCRRFFPGLARCRQSTTADRRLDWLRHAAHHGQTPQGPTGVSSS